MKERLLFLTLLTLSVAIAACSKPEDSPEFILPGAASAPPLNSTETFTMMVSGTDIGQLEVAHSPGAAQVDFEYRNNGRGPTITESVTFNEAGLPQKWTIKGHTTFGNGINEQFSLVDGNADWMDSTGNGVAIDPTLAIHEKLLRSRNGTVTPGMVDYIDHMPVGVQRDARTAPEILRWATLGMAEYLGQSFELGSIEAGKLADFFLVPGDPTADLKAIKTISMVVKNGTVYFPSEIYPEFGIVPFIGIPEMTLPE